MLSHKCFQKRPRVQMVFQPFPIINIGCLEILKSPKEITNWSMTNIALVPKVSKAPNVGNYRPISLWKVNNKVVSKTLANSLKHVLNNIISDQQSAFISGRAITDNFMIGHECIQFIKNKKNAGEKAWLLSNWTSAKPMTE